MLTRWRPMATVATVITGLMLFGAPASSQGGRVGAGPALPADTAQRQPDFVRTGPAGTTMERFKLLGHADLGADIDFGDLWVNGNFAYVGSRCGTQAQGGGGVRVVDTSDPTSPKLVAKLANPMYTRAEDLVVRDVSTASFTGTLAVVGIQQCFGSGHTDVFTGLIFFDVTHPAKPVQLAKWGLPTGAIGCHEVDFVQRPSDGKVLAGCARNLVDQQGGSTALHIVDATNPKQPKELSRYSLGVGFQGVGCLPYQFNHSVRFEDGGKTLYGSYWDAGTINLDVSDPSKPKLVGTTKIMPPDEEGDQHSMTLANAGKWLIINTEDFSPGDCPGQNPLGGWGEVYIYDNTNPAAAKFLGTFSTSDSRSTRRDGTYTDHNTEVWGATDQFFSSWYGDGVVWWTMDANGVTTQLGRFAPSAATVWGVAVDPKRDLVMASDMGSGLWIVRPRGL
jgi:hypothetical protein